MIHRPIVGVADATLTASKWGWADGHTIYGHTLFKLRLGEGGKASVSSSVSVAMIVNCRVTSSTDNESDRCRKLAKSHVAASCHITSSRLIAAGSLHKLHNGFRRSRLAIQMNNNGSIITSPSTVCLSKREIDGCDGERERAEINFTHSTFAPPLVRSVR